MGPLSVDRNRISESVGHRRITVRVRFPRIALLFAYTVSLALPLAAQSPNGTINGRVVDSSNGVIAGADILVINDVTRVTYLGKTEPMPARGFVKKDALPYGYSSMKECGGQIVADLAVAMAGGTFAFERSKKPSPRSSGRGRL